MTQNEDRRPGALAKHHSPIRWIFLFFLFSSLPRAHGAPVSNDSLASNSTENFTSNSTESFDFDSTENDKDLFELIQQFTEPPPNTTKPVSTIQPVELNNNEWDDMLNKEPLITKVAFDVGSSFRPTYAYITSESYHKYAKDLEGKCRKIVDDNIGDKLVDSLNNNYFRWEEYEFNKALLTALFPETTHNDYRRFLNTPKVINKIRLNKEIESQCQRIEQKDDWTSIIDERTSFEDYLINLIFQPRLIGEQAQAIIEDIEAYEHENQWDPRHFGNLTLGQNRKRRAATTQQRRMSRHQLEHEAKRLYREATRRH